MVFSSYVFDHPLSDRDDSANLLMVDGGRFTYLLHISPAYFRKDMDGTLVDSTAGVEGAWSSFAETYPHLNVQEILAC
jgi:hypothetical protein